MSQWIRNKSCEICGRIEVGLVEMNVGKTKHYLCYPCMADFASDVLDYARMNLTEKVNEYGNTYFIDEEQKPSKTSIHWNLERRQCVKYRRLCRAD